MTPNDKAGSQPDSCYWLKSVMTLRDRRYDIVAAGCRRSWPLRNYAPRVADSRACAGAEEWNVGFVVQNFGLFPHLTVAQNVAIARRTDRKDIETDKAISAPRDVAG